MDENKKSELVNAWIIAEDAVKGSTEKEDNSWATYILIHLAIDEPEETWEIILRIHNENISENVRGMLAAGPLEDLLVYHGEDFIERVRELATNDPLFKETLGGVWLDENDNPICEEFYKIAGVEMPFPKKEEDSS